MSNELIPDSPVEQMTLQEIEDLAMRFMGDDLHVVRHKGQVEVSRELRAIAVSYTHLTLPTIYSV